MKQTSVYRVDHLEYVSGSDFLPQAGSEPSDAKKIVDLVLFIWNGRDESKDRIVVGA